MNKLLRIIYLLLLLWGPGIHIATAQSDNSSDDALKSQALKLFTADKFEEAYPLYSQLVSLYPKDANYNYRLGVCMLFASDDKEKPVPFLEFASHNKEIDREVLYYLGKAYHLNYRFDEAIAAYFSYKKVASGSNALRLGVDRQIEMCKNGKQLLRKLSELVVTDKKEMSKEDFFRSYDISGIGGKLLVKPDEKEFKTALDKKKNDNSIVYLSSTNNQIYFASYGNTDKQGKDIFLIKKLPTGEWSKSQNLGSPINTAYDEDFPFLHPNGKVLYFCSKGHNSMGGFDIFKSALNEETNTWNTPVNLDFPINTPDDDVLYVTDQDEKEAYFSSSRSSIAGKTAVYHINVERKPIEFAVIKGQFIKNRDNQALNVKITVKDMNDNTILGIYNSDAETGIYLINLPNGGRFLYTVEAVGFATQSESIIIPEQFEFKPMKQEISYELNTEKLLVKNTFDEVIDDSNYLLALKYIKEKSKLDVSAIEAASIDSSKTSDALPEVASNQTETTTKTNTSLSNDDIVKIATNDATDLATEAKDSKEQADIALNFANQKNELAQNKTKEAVQLKSDASNANDPATKKDLIDKSTDAYKEADQLNRETVAAFNLAKKLEISAAAKQEEADLSQKYAMDLEAAVKSKNSTDALAKLDAQQKKLEELSQKNSESSSVSNSLKIDLDNKQRELDNAIQGSMDTEADIAGNEALIGNLSQDMDNTKNDELKKGLSNQIEELNNDIAEKGKALDLYKLQVVKLKKELEGIKNETELVNSVIDQSKTVTSEMAAANAASIDKNKLEEQVNNLKNSDSNTIASATNSNETSSGNTITSGTSSKNMNAETLELINQKYSTELTDTEKISNESDREKSKSLLFTNWEEAINVDIVKKKQELIKLTDPDFKSALSKQIDDEEQLAKEKRSQANISLAKLEAIKQQTALVTNNKLSGTNETFQNKAINENPFAEASADINIKFKTNLLDAEKIADAAEREQTKSGLYLMWAQAIDADIAKQKQNLAATTDPQQMAIIAKKIADEEQFSDDVQTQSDVSLAKLETIKQQTAIAANNTTSTTNESNANTANTTSITNSNTETSANRNQKFTDDLATTEKISNETDREKAKADVLKSWSEAINSDIAKKKQELATLTDPDYKTALSKQIDEEEQLAKEKQTQADASLAKVETINHQATLATNNAVPANNETTANSINNTSVTNSNTETFTNRNQKFSDDLAALEKISNEAEREQSKAGILKNWADSLNQDVAKKKQEFIAATSPETKSWLSQQIQEEEKLAQKKNNQANESLAKVQNLTQETSLATNDTVSKNSATNVNSSTTKSNPNIGLNSTISTSEKEFNYTTAESSTQIENANVINKQAEDLIAQSVEFKSKAAEQTDPAAKDELYAQSEELIKQANEKKLQASKLLGEVNKTEYSSNQNRLDQYEKAFTNNMSDEISMAEMMNDEGKIFFSKAQKFRLKADTLNSYFEKEELLQNAADAEMIALFKQKKSLDLYKKFSPGTEIAGSNTTSTTAATNLNPTTSNSTNTIASTTEPSINALANSTTSTNPDANRLATNNSGTNTDTTQAVIASTETVNDTLKNSLATNNSGINTDTTGNSVIDSTPNAVSNTVASNTATNMTESVIENPAVSTNTLTGSNTTSIVLAPNELYERKSAPVYSAEKPIPVNEKLPEGLIFKVQIGAFRNPIPQDLFAGMSPITGETTTQGYIRYTAGLFVKFSTADKVKKEIRDLGYKDAFVVAFLNGKRIQMNEALTLAGVDNTTEIAQTNPTNTNPLTNSNQQTGISNQQAITNNQESRTNNPESITNNNQATTNNQQTAINNQQPGLAPSQNISVVGGLFYTVQVGVFSQPVSSDKLNNVQPLYTETATNGHLRYNAGVYNNVARANEAKNMIQDAGIKDAYITAYYNGKRISLTEAKQLETQGSAIFSTASNMNVLPKFGSPSNQKSPGSTINSTIPDVSTTNQVSATNQTSATNLNQTLNTVIDQNNAMNLDTGLVFKVQVGAFKNEIPLEIANKFLAIAKGRINTYKDGNGLSIYTVGNYKTYAEAEKTKAEIASSGITDSFIVAYNKGKKISMDEAIDLKNK